jgi:hypothetical protein
MWTRLLDPVGQALQGLVQLAGLRGEFVLHLRRGRRLHGAGDEAVPLQVAQGDLLHTGTALTAATAEGYQLAFRVAALMAAALRPRD